MPVSVMGRMSQYFPEPERFLPERWNRENKENILIIAKQSKVTLFTSSI